MAEKKIYITLKIERLIDRIEISVPHDSGSTDSSEHRQISDSFLEKIEETDLQIRAALVNKRSGGLTRRDD